MNPKTIRTYFLLLKTWRFQDCAGKRSLSVYKNFVLWHIYRPKTLKFKSCFTTVALSKTFVWSLFRFSGCQNVFVYFIRWKKRSLKKSCFTVVLFVACLWWHACVLSLPKMFVSFAYETIGTQYTQWLKYL